MYINIYEYTVKYFALVLEPILKNFCINFLIYLNVNLTYYKRFLYINELIFKKAIKYNEIKSIPLKKKKKLILKYL